MFGAEVACRFRTCLVAADEHDIDSAEPGLGLDDIAADVEGRAA